MEVTAFSVINAIIGFIILPYTIVTGRLHMRVTKLQERMEETYTKKETKEIVELMTDPIKDNTERLIESQDKLIEALHRVELRLASNDS